MAGILIFVIGLVLQGHVIMGGRWNQANGYPANEDMCDTGHMQSPIAICLNETKMVYYPRSSGLQLVGYDVAVENAVIENTGETVKITIPPGTTKRTLSGPHLSDKTYTLVQFHFHWNDSDDYGSEHTINGMRYPMEMHLVHSDDDGNIAAVLSVLFQLGSNDGNAAMDVITKQFSKILDGPLNITMTDSFKISDLLPSDRQSFIHYKGSLTTPPCTEPIEWTLLPTLQNITAAQLAEFRRLRDTKTGEPAGEYRPLQPLNGRDVFLYENKAALSALSIWQVMAGLVAVMATRCVIW